MRLVFGAFALTVLAFCVACSERDVRGWWEISHDGKTYLVLEDSDGANCPPVFLDGREVALEIGRRVEIESGSHSVICGKGSDPNQGLGFSVREGTTYHFDYWGP